MAGYLRPGNLAKALAALGDRVPAVLAGGTDFYPARLGRPPTEDVLDITGLEELRRIEITPGQVRIGACVTWSELLQADLPRAFDGLKLAAREIGGIQIQNTATLAGNVCNASPAADGIPNLVALDAEVELTSLEGRRLVPIGAFVTGNRKTCRRPDELVTALVVPCAATEARSDFVKLGARKYLVISIVMIASVIEIREKRVERARIAIGACSAIACRLPALEVELARRPLDCCLAEAVRAEHLSPLTPIDDLRASAAYRRSAALVLLRRSLTRLGQA